MKQRQFLDVVSTEEALARFRAALGPPPSPAAERVSLAQALGRVVAQDVRSPADVPGFDRANMDGFALLASDSDGASELHPVTLALQPEQGRIGELPQTPLLAGAAMAIATGGALPRGANAVIPVEATSAGGGRVTLRRAVLPGAFMTHAGTDVARGELILRAGEPICAREVGVLAAVGLAEVPVLRRPRVAVLSTGDELVAPGLPAAPGQVHDANGHVLAAALQELGCEPLPCGIVADDEVALEAALRDAMRQADVVLLSGGTSKGPGDLNARLLHRLLDPPGVVVHGVAIKPGKPICMAVSGRQPVVVLPGFPTSAIFTFHQLVAPWLRQLAGRRQPQEAQVQARLPLPLRSEMGRAEHVMTHLIDDGAGQPLAYPIRKGSGAITSWSQADGYFVVDAAVERLDEGAPVTVLPMAGLRPRRPDLVVIGSHCIGLDVLLAALWRRGVSSKWVAAGSHGGLEAARRGACDAAGVHLLDAASGLYNRPFLDGSLALIEGYGRMQGLVFRHDDPRFAAATDARAALAQALPDPSLRLINRNRASGTRALIDALLAGVRPPGYAAEASSHTSVAAAVAQGRADFGVCIEVVTRDRGLGFLPLQEERYDFVVPRARLQRPPVQQLAALLAEPAVQAELRALGFAPAAGGHGP